MCSQPLKILAPAKLNLSLHVEGKLASGFHRIRSVIQPLSLSDTLYLSLTNNPGEIDLSCSFSEKLRAHIELAYPDLKFEDINRDFDSSTNLASRAARVFLQQIGADSEQGVAIRLEKNIPFEAGLGGGSSDAAAVLIGLNTLFEGRVSKEELRGLASKLGSDVPAMLLRGPSLVLGTGDVVLPLVPEKERERKLPKLLILKAPVGVSTPRAYQSLARPEVAEKLPQGAEEVREILHEIQSFGLTLPRREITDQVSGKELTFLWQEGISGVPENDSKIPWPYGRLVNDFESVVRADFEEIERCFSLLESAGAKGVVLAGSGSAVVGFLDSAEDFKLAELESRIGQGWFLEVAEFLL